MSDRQQLDLEAALAQIARDRAESDKLTAEVHKLIREAEKYRAEEQKAWRDWRLAPWILALTLIGSVIGGLIARHL